MSIQLRPSDCPFRPGTEEHGEWMHNLYLPWQARDHHALAERHIANAEMLKKTCAQSAETIAIDALIEDMRQWSEINAQQCRAERWMPQSTRDRFCMRVRYEPGKLAEAVAANHWRVFEAMEFMQ